MNSIIPHLPVRSVMLSVDFYCDVMGFSKAYLDTDENGGADFAILKYGDAQLMLSEIAGDMQPEGKINDDDMMMFYIPVDDVRTICDNISAKIKLKHELFETPWGTEEFWVEDPDGYNYAFFREL